MNDGDLLLRAVLEHPDEDTPRLAYADWFEEQGEPERAEFIRVQCEINRLRPECPCVAYIRGVCCRSMSCPICPLHRRETDLMREHGREWFGDSGLAVYGEDVGRMSPHATILIARRGFISEVRCPLATWLEHGPGIVRRHPVETVHVTDREPLEGLPSGDDDTGPPTGYYWIPDRHEVAWNMPWEIPAVLWDDGGHADFPTAEAAADWLSGRCLAWAKSPSNHWTPGAVFG